MSKIIVYSIQKVSMHSIPWNWVVALIVLQFADLISTRMALATGDFIEVNPIIAPIIFTWWLPVVKIIVISGVGIWLALRAPKVLKIATLIYFSIFISNAIWIIHG